MPHTTVFEEESPVGKKIGIKSVAVGACAALLGFFFGKEIAKAYRQQAGQFAVVSAEAGITEQRIIIGLTVAAFTIAGIAIGTAFEKRKPRRVRLVHED